MNKKYNDAEKAEIVSQFIDQMNLSGSASIEIFLEEYPELSNELEPLLGLSLDLKKDFQKTYLANEEVEKKFLKFYEKPTANRNQVVAVALDQRPDFMLLLLKMMDGVKGVTRLTKLLFLMGKEARFDQYVNNYYAHAADNFGPFDDVIFQDIEALKKVGFITEENLVLKSDDEDSKYEGQLYPNKVQKNYELTDSGKKFTEELFKKVEQTRPEVINDLKKIISKYGKLSLKSLLTRVYTDYPEYTVKSKIKDQILGNKKDEKKN